MERFSLIRVRSPLLTESLLFSLPVGTEMFHFPTFPPHSLCVQLRVTTSPHSAWRGFPIRTSSDQGSVINSPRLIADSYVLLRLLMPRHSPCALKNLTTKDQEAKKFERTTEPPTPKGAASTRFIHLRNCFLLRCSRPLCSSQTTTPSHPPPTPSRCRPWNARETRNTQPPPGKPHHNPGHTAPDQSPQPHNRHHGRTTPTGILLSQDPTVCQTVQPNHHPPANILSTPSPKGQPYSDTGKGDNQEPVPSIFHP